MGAPFALALLFSSKVQLHMRLFFRIIRPARVWSAYFHGHLKLAVAVRTRTFFGIYPLPVLVMPPCQRETPLEYSCGTNPAYAKLTWVMESREFPDFSYQGSGSNFSNYMIGIVKMRGKISAVKNGDQDFGLPLASDQEIIRYSTFF